MRRRSALMLILLAGCSKTHPTPPDAVIPEFDVPPVASSTPDVGCDPDHWDGCVPQEYGRATDKDAGTPELSRYGTVFDPIDGRTINIKTAAAKIDGEVILPNETFSFNTVVGIRTAKNGYVDAPVLLQGRRTSDLGGGVCQVSSTLHAAAIEGGLEIKERRPHSLVPKYIDPGYDATVAFPASCEIKGAPCEKLDLKIRNPFDMPVRIRAVVTDNVEDHGVLKGHLNVLLESLAPKYEVDVKRQTEPMGRGGRRWVRSGKILTASFVKVVQQAGEGYFVRCTATYAHEGKTVREFKWFSRYPPVDEVWEVGWARPADAGDPWP